MQSIGQDGGVSVKVFPHLWREGCYALPLATLAVPLPSDAPPKEALPRNVAVSTGIPDGHWLSPGHLLF